MCVLLKRQFLYIMDGSFEILLGILIVPRTLIFWIETSDVLPGV